MSLPWLRTLLAWARAGSAAFAELGREIDWLGGLPRERLLACEAEGRDGTRLGGCVKTYVLWPAGRFGTVMVAVRHPERRSDSE